jgi:8-amino-7-oxononanoate synthase
VAGAFIAGAADVIEWLVQRARTYVFSTATPPVLAVALQESLRLIESESWRRARLRELIAQLHESAMQLPWRLLSSETAIQPLIVGDNAAVLALAEALQARGLWVPAIRPPTVPEGSARLRISLSAAHTREDVARLATALKEVAEQDQQQ